MGVEKIQEMILSEKKESGNGSTDVEFLITLEGDLKDEVNSLLVKEVGEALLGLKRLEFSNGDYSFITIERGYGILGIQIREKEVDVYVYRKTCLPERIIAGGNLYTVNEIRTSEFYDSYIIDERSDEKMYYRGLKEIL